MEAEVVTKSVFETLNAINCNDHTEKKNGLTYLSWAWAWAEVKKAYPTATYTVWKDCENKPYVFDPALGFLVNTTVTIEGETHEMWLPVMDNANNAMKAEPYEYSVKNPNFKYATFNKEKNGYFDKYGNEQKEYVNKRVEAATMFDVNKAIMRCLVKNLAMFGLGLYIYAGEDLPEQPAAAPKADSEFAAVLADVAKAPDVAALTALWNEHPELQENQQLVDAIKNRRSTLTPQQRVAQSMANSVK